MKEHPILFTGEMVWAILEGRKYQTRRVIKPQPEKWVKHAGYDFFCGDDEIALRGMTRNGPAEALMKLKYQKGNLLWVRETWATVNSYDHLSPRDIPRGDKRWPQVWYGADPGAGGLYQTTCEFLGKVRPSIFMPRWASRITLEITNIRVEKVQEITPDDAKAEGVDPPILNKGMDDVKWRNKYMLLWDSINAKRGYSWDSNPWVWVIEFQRKED